mmetsp:Transcript_71315/g.189725  ORF Transcript_71315/g.189725 Transcript_71315/m.189725 type:complete len:97 (-) Transcript_71315:275-565(-)
MGLMTGAVGATYGTMVMIYANMLRKAPMFRRPWEHAIFGVCGGWWAAHKLVEGEEWAERTLEKAMRQKMLANQGVLDEQYRAVLGDKYSKYFPDSE